MTDKTRTKSTFNPRVWMARTTCGLLVASTVTLAPALGGEGADAAPSPHAVKPTVSSTDLSTLRPHARAAAPDAGLQARAAQVTGSVAAPKPAAAAQASPSAGAQRTAAPAAAPAAPLGTADQTVDIPVHGKLVGLSWPADVAPGSVLAVAWRTQQQDGTWSSWTPVADTMMVDSGGHTSGRHATDPMWIGDATTVQLRFPQGDARLAHARIDEIDPGASPADAPTVAPAGSAVALTSKPVIRTRAQWGADESLRQGCIPTIGRTVNGVVVHHDAGSNNYTAADSAAIVRSIYAYHTKVQGWCDIGYNVIVDKYGQAFEGRYGGLNVPVQGAHALGFNEDSFGVSMLGNYMTATPTSAGMDILARVIAWRLSGIYRNGTGTTQWHGGAATTRYPNVGTYTLPMIIGHRDVNFTDCPGTNLYALLPSLRTRVSQLISYTSSPIYSRYAGTGGSAKWGPVWMAETPVGSGMNETVATGGARFYTTPRFGVRWMGPGLDGMWRELGWTNWGGYPWTDEVSTPAGWYVELDKGKTLTMTRASQGTFTEGAIRGYWVSTANGSYGVLGLPVERMTLVNGFWQQRVQGGTVYYNNATGQTVHTEGGMDVFYRQRGFLTGSMGTPKGDVVKTTYGAQQSFTKGMLRWNRSTGAITFG